MRKSFTKIYGRLLRDCPAIEPPPRWRFLAADEHVRRLPENVADCVASLGQEFSEADLLASGVAVRSDSGLVPNPKLAIADRIAIVLQNPRGAFNIVTAEGSLLGAVPLFEFQNDTPTQEARGEVGTLLVAQWEDMVLLRLMDLPTAPITHLDRLGKAGLQELLYLVGGSSRGPLVAQHVHKTGVEIDPSGRVGGPGAGEAPCAMTLVGCSLVSEDSAIPAGVLAVARNLASAAHYLELGWTELDLWWPSPADLANLAYRASLADVAVLRDFFFNLQSLHRIDEFRDPSHLPGRGTSFLDVMDNLLLAQRELWHHPDSEHYRGKFQAARADYERQIDTVLFQPLVDSALSAESESLRAVRLQLAHVARLLHHSLPHVHAGQSCRLESGLALEKGFLPPESWRQASALMENVVKAIREETRLHERMAKRSQDNLRR